MNLPRISSRPEACACGATVHVVRVQRPGTALRCDACAAEHAATTAAAAKVFRETAAVARFNGELPPRYAWADLDAPELAVRVRPANAVERARRLTAAGGGAVLVGPSGMGKTSLAVAMLRDLHTRATPFERAQGFLFVSAYDLAVARSQTKLGDGEAEIVDRAMRATAIVLDDLGTEQDRYGSAVADVIHRRHDYDAVTIATTGFGQEAITSRYGTQVARRLFEVSPRITLGGK